MNRACLALSVLFATMAASFMAVGTAKSQTGIEAGLASQDEFACPLSHEEYNQCPWGHCSEDIYGPSVCTIETATNEEISEDVEDLTLKTFQDEDPSGLIAPLDLECHWVCDRYSFKFPPTNEIELNEDAAADVVVEETHVVVHEEEPPAPQEAPANTADEAATAAADPIEEEAYSYDEYPEYDWDYEKAYGNEFEYESDTAPAPPESVTDTDNVATEIIETEVASTEEEYDYGYEYEEDYGYDSDTEYGSELEYDSTYEDEYGYDYDAEYSQITEANEAETVETETVETETVETEESPEIDYDAEVDRLFETDETVEATETVEVEASVEETIETESEYDYDSEYDYESEYDYDSSYDYDTEYDYDYDAQVEAQEEVTETDETEYDYSEYEYDSEFDYEAEYGYDAEIETQNEVEATEVEATEVETDVFESDEIDDTRYDEEYYGDEYYEYGDEYFDDETVEPVAKEEVKTHFWVDNASDYSDNAADCFGADCADAKKPAAETEEIKTEQEPHTEYDWESEYLWQYEAIEKDTTGEIQVIEATPATTWTTMLLAAPRALIHTVEQINAAAEQTLCDGELRQRVEQVSIGINKIEASARLAERKERKRQRQTKSSQQRIWKTLAQLPTTNPYSVAAISVARAANNAVSTAVLNRVESTLVNKNSLLVR